MNECEYTTLEAFGRACPDCGKPCAWNSLHGGYTDCLNRDCRRMYGQVVQMSPAAIAQQLRSAADRATSGDMCDRITGIGIDPHLARRIADLLERSDQLLLGLPIEAETR